MKKTKTIPFSIEAWKAGGKPVTADGREVKHLTNFETDDQFPLGGAVNGIKKTWQINGSYTNFYESSNNLMLEVEDTEKELYLVVITTPFTNGYGMAYNVYVSDDIENATRQPNYLTHLKLPPCNS
jgi:hypothetical protein